MIKTFKFATGSALLASLFAVGASPTAEACHRFGGFGGGYSGNYYQSSYYTQPTYYQPAVVYQDTTTYSTPVQTVQTTSVPVNTAPSVVEQSRDAFKARNYGTALTLIDQALQQAPENSELLQFKSLILFTMGDFQKASAAAYSGIATGPAFDWPTIVQLVPSTDDYTRQYAALADQTRQNSDQASLHFLLGYHHLMLDHVKEGRAALATAYEKLPQDKLLPLLLSQLPAPTPTTPAIPSVAVSDAPPVFRP